MEFHVLGRIEVISDSGEPVTIGRPLVRGLVLALVLCRAEPLSVPRLLDLLWGPEADDRAASLRSCLWSARKVLPPGCLVAEAHGYRLRVEADSDRIDVDRFRRLHAQGRQALEAGENATAVRTLAAAMQLWGSGDLADLVPPTPAMMSLAAGLAEERRDARDALIQARIELGRHRELLPELRTLVALEPNNERLWEHLILALYRAGLKADALHTFDEAVRSLAMHLGVRPGKALRELRSGIQADDPALSLGGPAALARTVAGAGVPRQLPADLRDFTGRTEEAAELIGLLSPGERRTAVPVVVLSGPPGVGKSALAVHVGHAVSHDYPDGQLYVRLGGARATPLSASALLDDLLRSLGVLSAEVPETVAQRAAAFRSRLAGRRILLVLDDAASPDQIRPLIPGSAGCAVIVTSRAHLAGLAIATMMRLDPWTNEEALGLLACVLGDGRLRAEPQAADAVVRVCGGLPLAVRIAAERLSARPDWPIAHLATALNTARRRLDELVVGDLAMRASIASSYQALPASAQRVFRLLAAASSREVPDWVADAALGEPAGPFLADLVDHSLLVACGLDLTGQPRYRFHDLLFDYATELLHHDPEAAIARDRILNAWIELADRADAAIPRAMYVPLTVRPPIQARLMSREIIDRVGVAPLEWFATERGNLLAAVEAACESGKYRPARELALRVAAYLHLHSYHDEAARMWTLIADAAEHHGDVHFGARAWLRAAAVIAADRGEPARALPVINRCIEVFEAERDRQRLARAYGLRSYCNHELDHLTEAHADGTRGLELAQRLTDPHAEFFCLRMLTLVLGELDRHAEALTCAQRTLAIAGELNSDAYRCSGLFTLAKAHLRAGQPDKVIEIGTRGLALAEQIGREPVYGHFHQQIGLARQQLHQHRDAIDSFDLAARAFTARRDRYPMACCLRAAADSYQATGLTRETIRHLNEAISVFRDLRLHDREIEARQALTQHIADAR